MSWFQANTYAQFKKARLPTESEWEYVAKSGGDQKYPWDNEYATCERTVMYGKDAKSGTEGYGCGNNSAMPVCSKPKSALGLCDAVGNVWQWVQDTYQTSYAQTPPTVKRMKARLHPGAAWRLLLLREVAGFLRADFRDGGDPGYRNFNIEFRLARSSR